MNKMNLQMKQSQTFKFDPDLIDDLNKEAKGIMIPFNRYVENLLKTHPTRNDHLAKATKRKDGSGLLRRS